MRLASACFRSAPGGFRPAAMFAPALLAVAAACTNTTEVQRRFVDFRDECRAVAEQYVAGLTEARPTESQRDVNAQLAAVFGDCMSANGWTVAAPASAPAAPAPAAAPAPPPVQAAPPAAGYQFVPARETPSGPDAAAPVRKLPLRHRLVNPSSPATGYDHP